MFHTRARRGYTGTTGTSTGVLEHGHGFCNEESEGGFCNEEGRRGSHKP
jgi:hypothetical protein